MLTIFVLAGKILTRLADLMVQLERREEGQDKRLDCIEKTLARIEAAVVGEPPAELTLTLGKPQPQ